MPQNLQALARTFVRLERSASTGPQSLYVLSFPYRAPLASDGTTWVQPYRQKSHSPLQQTLDYIPCVLQVGLNGARKIRLRGANENVHILGFLNAGEPKQFRFSQVHNIRPTSYDLQAITKRSSCEVAFPRRSTRWYAPVFICRALLVPQIDANPSYQMAAPSVWRQIYDR